MFTTALVLWVLSRHGTGTVSGGAVFLLVLADIIAWLVVHEIAMVALGHGGIL